MKEKGIYGQKFGRSRCADLPAELTGRRAVVDICLEAVGISRVKHMPLPFDVSLVSIGLDMLDMAQLAPLWTRFPKGYGCEQL